MGKVIEIPDPNDWSGEHGQFFHDVTIRYLKANGIGSPNSKELAEGYREVQKQLKQAVGEGKAKVQKQPLSEAEKQQLRERIIADAALWNVEQSGGTADDYMQEVDRIKREEVGQ